MSTHPNMSYCCCRRCCNKNAPNPEQTYRPKKPVAPKTQTFTPASLALPPRPVSVGRRSVMRGKSCTDDDDDEKLFTFFGSTATPPPLLLLIAAVVVVRGRRNDGRDDDMPTDDGSRRSNIICRGVKIFEDEDLFRTYVSMSNLVF